MDAVSDRLKSRIQTVMRQGGRTQFPFTAAFLKLCSHGYREAVRIRAAHYEQGRLASKRLPCKVVSVGNLTVGGTGKTPMTVYLAELIQGFGLRVAVLSRGYRGLAEQRGGVVSDGRRMLMGCEEAGDEPFMMASALKGVPVIVGRDRYQAGRTAIETFGTEIVLLDDAFQHLQLSRDLDIVLLDGRNPVGNAHLLPRGPLREPVSALKRANAIVLTHFQEGGRTRQWPGMYACIQGTPLFHSSHVPSGCWVEAGAQKPSSKALSPIMGQSAQMLAGRRVLAFSGIAGNHGFHQTVQDLGGSVQGFIGFDDHHEYSRSDCLDLCRRVKELKADAMVTTHKDYVKIAHFSSWPVDLAVIDIRLSFGQDAPGLHAFVRDRLSGR